MAEEVEQVEGTVEPQVEAVEFTAEQIEHVGNIVMDAVQDDEKFKAWFSPRIEGSWNPALVQESITHRIIVRAMLELM